MESASLLLLIALISLVVFSIKRFFLPRPKWCLSQRCLVGKTTLVTGGNTGIGYQTALDFAKRGAKVIIACRDPKKAEEARKKIIEATDNPNVFVKLVDFSSFASVRKFADGLNKTETHLDILVNNIGMSFAYDEKSVDGYDLVMQVNYFSHFLLTHLLIGLLRKSPGSSRIVNVASLAAKFAVTFDIDKFPQNEGNLLAYSNSKLCNILFTKELAKKLANTNITTYSLHPGGIKTEIFKTAKGIDKFLSKIFVEVMYYSPIEGCQTIVYCSVEKNLEKYSGAHFDNCRKVDFYKTAQNSNTDRKLWEITESIVGLKENEKLNF